MTGCTERKLFSVSGGSEKRERFYSLDNTGMNFQKLEFKTVLVEPLHIIIDNYDINTNIDKTYINKTYINSCNSNNNNNYV